MRFFAIVCFTIALYYGWDAVGTMRSGVAYALRGEAVAGERRDDAQSHYSKYLAARWLLAGGFALLGGTMMFFAGRLEKLEGNGGK